MSCVNPTIAVDYGINPETGKHVVKMLPHRVDYNLKTLREKYGKSLLLLPCGHCLACMKNYRCSWSVRMLLEAQLYEHNCFITLTYHPACLPKDNKPHRDEIQRFFKRLRKTIGCDVRYFYCGEKGDKNPTGDETGGRAHYHALLFGYDFPDKELFGRTSSGSLIYRSRTLEKCWPFGHSSIGDIDPGSACYVAGYSTKKLKDIEIGDDCKENREVCFVGMSRRPGLGAAKFDLNWFKSETIYNALGESNIPRFFEKMLQGIKPQYFEKYKEARRDRLSQRIGNMKVYGLNEEETLFYEYNCLIVKQKNKKRGSL